MSASFLDDFDGDYFDSTVLEELQTALAKAVKSSPKSIVTAHYPTKNYETAAMRLHIEANLETIRKNRNNQKGIKIYVDGILDSGGYTSDIDPNFAMTQMSYSQFCSLTKIRFLQNIALPLGKRIGEWDAAHGFVSDPFNAFDGAPEPERPKKQPTLLKCEIELESMDESVVGETVLEPTRQKLRAMYQKATTNKQKCKMHIRSTLPEKEYDSLETGVEETGLIYVSLIKDGIAEKSKSANTTVAYRIINEYLEKGTVADMDAIEQEVLSAPPKPQKKQPVQNNSSPAGGCLGVGILIVIGAILIYNLIQLILIL